MAGPAAGTAERPSRRIPPQLLAVLAVAIATAVSVLLRPWTGQEPVMDGAATIRALRALDPAVRVVAGSGLAHETDDDDGPPNGHTRYLQKPYSTEELLRTLDAALREPS